MNSKVSVEGPVSLCALKMEANKDLFNAERREKGKRSRQPLPPTDSAGKALTFSSEVAHLLSKSLEDGTVPQRFPG